MTIYIAFSLTFLWLIVLATEVKTDEATLKIQTAHFLGYLVLLVNFVVFFLFYNQPIVTYLSKFNIQGMLGLAFIIWFIGNVLILKPFLPKIEKKKSKPIIPKFENYINTESVENVKTFRKIYRRSSEQREMLAFDSLENQWFIVKNKQQLKKIRLFTGIIKSQAFPVILKGKDDKWQQVTFNEALKVIRRES